MQVSGARFLVCGATGVLGRELSRALVDNGARVVAAGRDRGRLADLADELQITTLPFDAVDVTSCERMIDEAAVGLGGLDGLVVATGVAAFGPALDADAAVTEELMAVNVLAPMALVRAAAHHLTGGSPVVVLSAVLADVPTVGMAEYSASKSALSAWLSVLRREERRRLNVIDVRPPHLDTGLQDRALSGTPPKLPVPVPARHLVDAVLSAVESDAHTVGYEADKGTFSVR